MRSSWVTTWVLKGFFAIMASGAILLLLDEPGVIDSVLDWVYLLLTIAFDFGILMVGVGAWEYFFGSSGMANYVYRPKSHYILVRYSTCPFKIERDGFQIWIGMVLDAQLRHRKITLRETVSSPSNLFKKDYFSGTTSDDVFVTEDGQTLKLSRGVMGIKISWDENEAPWKIVGE